MDPRLDLLTLAVEDLDTARRFYLDDMGWTASLDVPGQIVFLQLNHGLLLGLVEADDLEVDLGSDAPAGIGGEGARVVPGAGFTLAHNVGSRAAVEETLQQALEAGARIVKPAQDAAFGGYHGYFLDPAGIRWEVAYNPGWRVDAEGHVTISTLE